MTIKRRIDYEQYERLKHQRPWRRMYQIGNKVYRVMMIHNPAFWKEWLECTFGFGIWRVLRGIYLTLRYDVIVYHGQARTTEELDAEAEEFNKKWKELVDSGAIERLFNEDVKALDINVGGDTCEPALQ